MTLVVLPLLVGIPAIGGYLVLASLQERLVTVEGRKGPCRQGCYASSGPRTWAIKAWSVGRWSMMASKSPALASSSMAFGTSAAGVLASEAIPARLQPSATVLDPRRVSATR